jgi:hypothetical protein
VVDLQVLEKDVLQVKDLFFLSIGFLKLNENQYASFPWSSEGDDRISDEPDYSSDDYQQIYDTRGHTERVTTRTHIKRPSRPSRIIFEHGRDTSPAPKLELSDFSRCILTHRW